MHRQHSELQQYYALLGVLSDVDRNKMKREKHNEAVRRWRERAKQKKTRNVKVIIWVIILHSEKKMPLYPFFGCQVHSGQ